MSFSKQPKKYLICAGEPSGDLLAADVISAFKKLAPEYQAYGITGRHMEAAGAIPIARTDELMVMGFIDVIKKLPSLVPFEQRFIANAKRMQPAFIILVDYPGLHLRFAEKLRDQGFPIFQLVAPQLWAWKEKRVYEWKKHIDMMLGVMPFEEEFFAKYELKFKYVGTPQADRVRRMREVPYPWPFNKSIPARIGFFPGSRESEFVRMAPAFLATIRELQGRGPYQYFMSIGQEIPLALVERVLRQHGWSSGLTRRQTPHYEIYSCEDLTLLRGHSMELMAGVEAAVVTSGTATLECGLIGTPMCVAYKTSNINYAIAKRVVTLPNIALVNIVAGERLVQEFVQDLSPLAIADELEKLARNGEYRDQVRERLASLHHKVRGHMGETTAQTILDYLPSKT